MNPMTVPAGILIDQIAVSFEQHWRSGERQTIEELIAAHAAVPSEALLFELLMVEFELRITIGQAIEPEEYLRRFAGEKDTVLLALAESGLRSANCHSTVNLNAAETAPAADSKTTLPPPIEGTEPATLIADMTLGPRVNPLPRMIADYEILSPLGEGGMGIVYRARQMTLNRIVALKVIRSGQLATDEELQRFRIEAEAAARLVHPNIVSVFDYGSSDGVGYLAMPFVDGITLREKISRGTFAFQAAAVCLSRVARAIAYAHGQGILHRDLKPENILLRKTDEQPLVTDFGLARLVGSDDHVTRAGQMLGTPQFMPPEQAGGGTGKTDERSDVYSLGALLYYSLTAKPPFNGATAMQVIAKVLNDEPVAPRSLDESIPRDLETICLKCLGKHPDSRYSTAAALAEDLDRFVNGQSILARPRPLLQRLAKWCLRKPWQTTVIGLTILLLAGSTSAAFVFQRQSEREKLAKEEALLAKADAQDATIQSEALQLKARLNEYSLPDSGNFTFPADLQSLDTAYLERVSQRNLIPARKFLGGDWGLFDSRLSADGKRLIAVDQSGLLILWDISTGKTITKLTDGVWSDAEKKYHNYFHFENGDVNAEPRPEFFFSVDWLSDNSIVAATDQGRILKFDIDTKQQTVITQRPGPIHFVRRDPQTGNLLLCSADGGMQLVDSDGAVLATVATFQSMPTCASFEHKERLWTVGFLDGTFTVLNDQLEEVASARLGGPVRDFTLVRQGERVLIYAAAGNEGIRQWQFQSEQQQLTEVLTFDTASRPADRFFQSIVVDTDLSRLMALDSHGFISTWNTVTQAVTSTNRVTRFDDRRYTVQKTFPPVFQRMTTDLMIAGPSEILCLEESGVGIVFDTAGLKPPNIWSSLKTQVGPTPDIVPAQGDGSLYWSLDGNGALMLVDVARDQIVGHLRDAHQGGTPTLVPLADGTLVSVGGNSLIKFWTYGLDGIVETRRLEYREKLISIAVHEPTQQIATVTASAKLVLWSLVTGRIAHTLDVGDGNSIAPLTGRVDFSADGRYIAAFGAGQQFEVFDTMNDFSQVTLGGHYHQARGKGGTAMIWSPSRPDRLAVADGQGSSGSWIRGELSVFAETRINTGIAQDEILVDFTATPDRRRILGVTSTGHLQFLTAEHFIRTLSLDCGMMDCCAVSVSDVSNTVMIADHAGRLRLAQFSEFELLPATERPLLTGTRHPLLQHEDRKRVAMENVCLDSAGRGVSAIRLATSSDSRRGDLYLIRRRDSVWRLDPVRLPLEYEPGFVFAGGSDVGFAADNRCLLAFRQMIPPAESYDGQLLLGHEQPDNSWKIEIVMSHGNAGHRPLMVFDLNGQVSSILHFNYGGMHLLQSTRGPAGEFGWPVDLLRDATGLSMSGRQTRNGVVHATMSRARENSDPAPSDYLRLEPGKPPEFSPNPGGQIQLLSDGSPVLIHAGMRFLRLVDGDWQLWTQFPGDASGTRHATGCFIAADNSIWVVDHRPHYHKVYLWRFFNNTWTALEILADFPPNAVPNQLWIEENDRITIAFQGNPDSSGFHTLDIIDAMLPQDLRPAR